MVKLYYRKPRKRSQESYGAVVGWLVDCNEEGVRFAPAAAREEVAAWLGFALEPLCCQLLPAKASAYMIRNEDLPCQPRLFIASVGDNFYWSGVTPGRVCWFADGCGQQTSFASLARACKQLSRRLASFLGVPVRSQRPGQPLVPGVPERLTCE